MSVDILMVGTNTDLHAQIRAVLEAVGYQVVECSVIEEAMGYFEPNAIQLVFLDTGSLSLELGEDIARIRGVNNSAEFVLVAEYQDPLVEQEAQQQGVNRWLYEPFTAPEIILTVASALEMGSSVGPEGIGEQVEQDDVSKPRPGNEHKP